MSEELVTRIEFGSHLYGTSTPTSDHDYKSVHIPGAHDILLQRVQDSTGHKVKRSENEKNTAEDTDDESYSLQRYLGLLAEGQTVAVDMLFAPVMIVSTPLWEEIYANRERLLTKKSKGFVEYCRTQANKYGIKGSRVAAAKKAAEFFSWATGEFGATSKVEDAFLPEHYEFDEHTRILTKETTPGKQETYFECCNRMVGVKNTVKEAASIYGRIYDNYGVRARLAQDNAGIDWKALSHAVRVGNEALELLSTMHVTFPLPNAAHVLEIKKGLLPYKQVAEEIEGLLVEVEAAAASSSLRDDVDTHYIDYLVEREYLRAVRNIANE